MPKEGDYKADWSGSGRRGGGGGEPPTYTSAEPFGAPKKCLSCWGTHFLLLTPFSYEQRLN